METSGRGRTPIAAIGFVVLLSALLPTAALAWTPSSHRVIENRGQVEGPAAFYAFGGGVTLYFTEDAVVLDFTEEGHAVWMHIEGRSQSAGLEARGLSPATLNFFLGNDPTRWESGIRMYEEVVYHDAWPGIDLRFSPETGRLRYEIVTQHDADPEQARFRFEGMDRTWKTADGSVWLDVSSSVVRDAELFHSGAKPPGTESRYLRWGTDVDALGDTKGPGATGNLTGSRDTDHGRDDPSKLIWCTLIGGSHYDRPHGLVLDSSDHPFITGYTKSTDFPVNPGTYDPSHNGEYDVYVTKFAPDVSDIIWSTFIGGSGWDRAFAIHLDSAGNPTFSGLTESADFPTTDGAYDRTLGGYRDGFAAKLDPTGRVLIWSTYLGGSGTEWPFHMILDAEDRPLIVGETSSADYPTTDGAYDRTYNGLTDGCVTKLDALGSSIVWSTYLGGSRYEQISWVDLGPDQGPIMCGATESYDYPTTTGAYDVDYGGGRDCIVSKLDSVGESLVYSTFLGGTLNDFGNAIAVDPSGEAVVTGSTQSTEFPTTPGTYDTDYSGGKDVFVARIGTGAELIWSTLLGGNQDEEPFAFFLEPGGNPLVAGSVSSPEFPTTFDAYDQSYNGNRDAFLTRMNDDGSDLLWSSFLGGEHRDDAFEVVLHSSGDPVVAGQTYGGSFPTTEGAYDRTHNGLTDVYLARFGIGNPAGLPEGFPDSPATWLSMSAEPNPFTDVVRIHLDLQRASEIRIVAFDAVGRRIVTLDQGYRAAGLHRLVWNGRDRNGHPLAAGVYWIRVEADRSAALHRLTRVR